MLTRASTVYNSGVASLDHRQLDEARQYRNQLQEVKNNVKEFETLPDKLEQVYNSVKQIAKEQIAVQQAEALHNNGLIYVNNVDIKLLKQIVSNLEDLSTVLNQEYKLRIVSREDVSSGVERGYNNLPSNYYVVVEAIDSNGNVLTKRITSEEDGNTKEMEFWGERVPLTVFEGVKSDKMDDGIIQNNIFAKKSVGYLSEEIILNGVTGRAQITEWDE